MVHAFLVTAYKDYASLIALIEQLLAIPHSRIYINVDARSISFLQQIKGYLKKFTSSRVYLQAETVRWGSYQHFDVYMQLATKAARDNCDYYHTITGQCRITKPLLQFYQFFQEHQHLSFIQHVGLPDPSWNGLGQPRLDRVKFYHLHDILDARKIPFLFDMANSIFIKTQKFLRINRLKNRIYYSGSTYFSVNKEAVAYLLSEYKKIKKEFRYTYCCEETVAQTILLNGPKEIKVAIVNEDLRYILWAGYKHGEIPGILDEEDFLPIQNGNFLFARKFDSVISQKLVQKMNDLDKSDPLNQENI